MPWWFNRLWTWTPRGHERAEKEVAPQFQEEHSILTKKTIYIYIYHPFINLAFKILLWLSPMRRSWFANCLCIVCLASEWSMHCFSLSIGFVVGYVNPNRRRTFPIESGGIVWATESCPSGGPYNQAGNRLGNWGHQVSLGLGEVVISLRMKRIVSKSGKQILTVYRKNWFWDADSCSPCIFMVVVVAAVLLLFVLCLVCFLGFFFFFGLVWFPMGKKILTLGSEREKTWTIILCFQYKHIYLNWS